MPPYKDSSEREIQEINNATMDHEWERKKGKISDAIMKRVIGCPTLAIVGGIVAGPIGMAVGAGIGLIGIENTYKGVKALFKGVKTLAKVLFKVVKVLIPSQGKKEGIVYSTAPAVKTQNNLNTSKHTGCQIPPPSPTPSQQVIQRNGKGR